VLLALFGHFYIVGPLTLLVLPLALLIVLIMYKKQKTVFNELGLTVRQNLVGFLVYMLVYQVLMSPICVIGYGQELIGMTKKW
jgi:biofilm PGA synthesis N-glycosyltransferase PgaC